MNTKLKTFASSTLQKVEASQGDKTAIDAVCLIIEEALEQNISAGLALIVVYREIGCLRTYGVFLAEVRQEIYDRIYASFVVTPARTAIMRWLMEVGLLGLDNSTLNTTLVDYFTNPENKQDLTDFLSMEFQNPKTLKSFFLEAITNLLPERAYYRLRGVLIKSIWDELPDKLNVIDHYNRIVERRQIAEEHGRDIHKIAEKMLKSAFLGLFNTSPKPQPEEKEKVDVNVIVDILAVYSKEEREYVANRATAYFQQGENILTLDVKKLLSGVVLAPTTECGENITRIIRQTKGVQSKFGGAIDRVKVDVKFIDAAFNELKDM